jgi:dimethylargininase
MRDPGPAPIPGGTFSWVGDVRVPERAFEGPLTRGFETALKSCFKAAFPRPLLDIAHQFGKLRNMTGASIIFTHALCRAPARSVTQGLRAVDHGAPDPEEFAREHGAYAKALRATGARVTVLPAQEEFPDSVFIEDPALILKGVAILLRPGSPSRLGEAAALAPDLARLGLDIRHLPAGGFADGGDILCSDSEVMVGLSARTDRAGIAGLQPIVENLGYRLRIVETPPEILHFKTECSLLDPETVLATPRLAATGCFDRYTVIETAEGEDAAANAIRFNASVFLASGHPKTAERLEAAGFSVTAMSVGQAALLDGGLSCMSLRYTMPT